MFHFQKIVSFQLSALTLITLLQTGAVHASTENIPPLHSYEVHSSTLQALQLTDHFEDRFFYISYAIDPSAMRIRRIQHFIARFGVESKKAKQLAQQIETIARCFQIDSYVFSALIARESGFNSHALSPTGAKGLTQMTPLGMWEVSQQFGLERPETHDVGTPSAIQVLTRMTDHCLVPKLETHWIPPFDLPAVKQHAPYSSAWTDALSEVMLQDDTTSLIYGAALFRTLLIDVTHIRAQSKDPDLRKTEEIFKEALRRYNGDELEKDNYQRIIMNYHLSELLRTFP